ncbi:coiled-coil domain-containing protein 12 [Trichogramma pretiosum]|uniref:Coiled-coil domain-containing protein 12 n=1 Tax=Trichogramma kaykai TaxID=54128 RepID=A0ABD2W411_9HYME|nr:coiled-coil domain-containing protein 12 [Trichogramma pretiosum]
MNSEEKVGTLVDEALKRKEKLNALKKRKAEDITGDKDSEAKLPAPKFRSYKPLDESLKEKSLGDAKPGDAEAEVKDQLDAATQRPVIEELDINNLAPRKLDWDLKRDVSKKLEKLQRRTQKAIAELILERLRAQKDISDATTVGDNLPLSK